MIEEFIADKIIEDWFEYIDKVICKPKTDYEREIETMTMEEFEIHLNDLKTK